MKIPRSRILPPKRILVINNLYPPQELGGYGRLLCDFANILKKRGHTIQVLTSDTPYLGQIEKDEFNINRGLLLFGGWQDGVCRQVDDKDRIIETIKTNLEKVRSIVGRFRPELCLLGNIDFLSHLVVSPLLKVSIPVIHHLGNKTPGYGVSHTPQSNLYRLATASRWLRDEIMHQGYPLKEISVVYPGALVEEFRMHVLPAPGKLRIAYAGIVLPYKGPHILIMALKRLHDRGKDFSCALAGTTTDMEFVDQLKKFVVESGMEDKIDFLGFLPREKLKVFFARHNILVFPSIVQEAFGISQVEAMAAGLTVVSSGTGGAKEIIEHGKSGLIFESNNSESLAQELLGLTENLEKWQSIAEGGRKRAIEEFDIERSVDILEQEFSNFIRSQRPAVGEYKQVKTGGEVRGSSDRLENQEEGASGETPILLIKNKLLSDKHRLRLKIALKWLNTSSSDLSQLYTGDMGRMHRDILTSDYKNFPLLPEERKLIATQIALIKGDQQTSYFMNQTLAAMLYLGPHQVPIEFDVERLPDWFQLDYWHFLLSPPKIFHELNEVENYYCYFKDLVEFLYQKIWLNPSSQLWRHIAIIFTQKANFIPLYFSKEKLTDLYQKRAEIAEFALNLSGFKTDILIPPNPPYKDKIRLGIYADSIAPYSEIYATLPIFEHLNHEEFETFLYVTQSDNNPLELYAKQLVDRFMVLPEDIKTCSDFIRSDNLDILFFCNNITAVTNQAFILANHRLARKQLVHFCQPASTGVKHVDHFLIGNMVHENVTAANQYSEKLVKLEGSGLCFDLHTQSSETNTQISREMLGIKNNTIMFISGANFFKIIPELRYIWAKIISKVPDSKLVLYPFGPAWSNSYPKYAFINAIEDVFQKHHVSKERLVVIEPLPDRGNIISLLRCADVYLDAVPYSGATSLLDPLEAGVPPVVVQGDKLRFNQGAAILKDLGVSELVAKNGTEYMHLALMLAHDKAFRSRVRHAISTKMRERPRFLNPESYAKEISCAMKTILQSGPELHAT